MELWINATSSIQTRDPEYMNIYADISGFLLHNHKWSAGRFQNPDFRPTAKIWHFLFFLQLSGISQISDIVIIKLLLSTDVSRSAFLAYEMR